MEKNKYALPYGLCKKYGIKLPDGATPREAWEALKKKTGMSAEEFLADYQAEQGTLLSSPIYVGKSVGAKVSNYNIEQRSTGEIFHIAEGTYIQNIAIFAGYGTSHPLNEFVVEGLVKEYGGAPEKWRHCKGFADIECDYEIRRAEIHWFQEKNAGRHKFKIKEWII